MGPDKVISAETLACYPLVQGETLSELHPLPQKQRSSGRVPAELLNLSERANDQDKTTTLFTFSLTLHVIHETLLVLSYDRGQFGFLIRSQKL